MRVALCFWGLCRSTHLTIGSIQTHIFDALKQQNIEYDVFCHTYTIHHEYTNVRADEIKCMLQNDNWKLLQPMKFLVDNQEEVDLRLQLESYRIKGDPWANEPYYIPYATLDNHIRALWSLHQVSILVEQTKTIYDYIVFLRPDVSYFQPLKAEYFTKANDATIVIPDFHHFFGSNDRFAICTPHVAKLYSHRFLHAHAYSLKKQLHAEGFLTDTLKTAGIQIQSIPFRFRRIRANGRIAEADRSLTAHT
jgi:hypothetical protein